jgi:cytochrome c-type biogenesis protein CcmH/NrfG
MGRKKWLVFGIVILGSLVALSAFSQPALAAVRVVQFDNPGCE